jgi:hypothetical protein
MRDDRKRKRDGIRWMVISGMTFPRGIKHKMAIKAYIVSV